MSLTIEQMRDLTRRINRLTQLGADRDKASDDCAAANRRWNKARADFATAHAEIVATYGEQHAPRWIDAIHGPRTTARCAGCDLVNGCPEFCKCKPVSAST